jgi:division protein CdvB (Snf7/Vps24/ESCRT-III family)
MKTILAIAAAAASLLIAEGAFAQDPHGHDAKAAPPAKSQPRAGEGNARLAEHMKQMQALHERMASATTPDERQKAMEDARKAMQDSMASLQGMMGPGGTMGRGRSEGNPSERMRSMEQRMDMMQMMMQMMMDQQGMAPGSMGGAGPAK